MKDEPEQAISIVPAEADPNATAIEQKRAKVEVESTLVEPEWVISYRARRKGQWLRWITLLVQWLVGAVVAWIFIMLPIDPATSPFHNWKNAVVVFLLICFIGKTLIDTLFYDHYQP